MLGSFADTFERASCSEDQGCVPDDVVKAGSNLDLQKCNAVLDTEGRCFWPLAKDIVANYDMLKTATKDQCPAEMVCAPCINPLTNQPTGVCDVGASSACGANAAKSGNGGANAAAGGKCPQVDPILDVSTFTADTCGSGMLCVDANLVPAGQAQRLSSCSKGKCAPKKSVERAGNYVPKTCRSTGGAEGRCTNASLPDIAKQASLLPQADCDADERCAPCFDPRTGEDTGACHQASCDAPKEPKMVFAPCCGSKGRCVPTSAVDGSSSALLAADSCTGDTPLCAPNELVGVTPPKKCGVAFGLIDGICISSCTIVLGGDLVQGDCADGEMCAPCDLLPNGSCK
jgi:hypothetical protein